MYRVTPSKIIATISTTSDAVDDMLSQGGDTLYTMLQVGNDITFKRMEIAVDKLIKMNEDKNLPAAIQSLFDKLYDVETQPHSTTLNLGERSFNESQIESIHYALEAPKIALIHGPPGTGKTTTVVEFIYQAVLQGKKVLACAPSNVAVDNLVEKLIKYKVPIVRMGHPARLLETSLMYSLDDIYQSSNDYEVTKAMSEDMKKLEKEIRGTSEAGVRKMKWKEWRETKAELKRRETEGLKRVAEKASVVLATCTGADDRVLRNIQFDVVVIDEAGQCLDPILLVPAFKADKVVLAGDHLQLPPTIKSTVAIEKGYCTSTFFERIITTRPGISRMLNVQYRMNEVIMKYSSDSLYGGNLLAADQVKDHLLSDLDSISSSSDDYDAELVENPVIFVDTAGCDMYETGGQNESKYNEGEALITIKIIQKLLKMGLPQNEIGVISPYNAQVGLIKSKTKALNINVEVHSVDSFQGREKEAIIISFVRSNQIREVGFLTSDNRTNVAITRARRLLVAIADTETISAHPFLKNFMQYCEDHCQYWSAEEFRDDNNVEVSIPVHNVIDVSPSPVKEVKKQVAKGTQSNHPKKAIVKPKKTPKPKPTQKDKEEQPGKKVVELNQNVNQFELISDYELKTSLEEVDKTQSLIDEYRREKQRKYEVSIM